MRLYEELEIIVQEETQSCSAAVQAGAMSAFREWFNREGEAEGQFCREVRTRIRDGLEKRERGPARQALHRVSERFAMRQLLDAKKAQSNRRYVERTAQENGRVLEFVRQKRKGVVFFGTARSEPGETEYERARELSRETAGLLPDSTIWNGAGPGDMDAITRGAKEGGGAVGGIKIRLSETQSAFEQKVSSAFDAGEVVECDYFHPRKVGLADAAARENESERTALICLPGGSGTMDEFYEVATLMQLKIIGKAYPFPMLLMNYNGEYDGIIAFMERAACDGRLTEKELAVVRICTSNREALDALADFYKIPKEQRTYAQRLRDWNE